MFRIFHVLIFVTVVSLFSNTLMQAKFDQAPSTVLDMMLSKKIRFAQFSPWVE